jgi:hypothetical protein
MGTKLIAAVLALFAFPAATAAQSTEPLVLHESAKSARDLSECIAKLLGRAGKLHDDGGGRYRIKEMDGSGREAGHWQVLSNPEGSSARFHASRPSFKSSGNVDSCM